MKKVQKYLRKLYINVPLVVIVLIILFRAVVDLSVFIILICVIALTALISELVEVDIKKRTHKSN